VIINHAQGPFLEDTFKRAAPSSLEDVQSIHSRNLRFNDRHRTRPLAMEPEAAELVAATREGLDRVTHKTSVFRGREWS